MSPSPSVPVLGSSGSPPRRRALLRTLQGAVFLGWGHRSRQGHGLLQGTREGVQAEVGALGRSHQSEADEGPARGAAWGFWGGSQRFGPPFGVKVRRACPGTSRRSDLKPSRVLGLAPPPHANLRVGPMGRPGDPGPQPGGGAAALGPRGGSTPPQAVPPASSTGPGGGVNLGCSRSCPHPQGGRDGGGHLPQGGLRGTSTAPHVTLVLLWKQL